MKNIIISTLVLSLSLGFSSAFATNHDHSDHHNHGKKTEHSKVEKKNKKKDDKNNIKAILTPKMSSYPKMKPVKLTLNLKSNGKAIEKASILMDLTMPEMAMPKNEVNFKEVSKGVYEGDAMFTMSGKWRLITLVTTGSQKETINFDIIVD